ncbi:MAG: hypothetical protein EZS26_000877 [Candidatus Ordinivivax streblomastigis]|uniref:Septum formation initiator n=1 Tax=Candidatus Ordinivivax streblomastigis TaxID=2540710 RepID=A0A5M8P3R5_9BACT|nr:MAG: hypothetical protein EZS26_000877 [Candidatus Ordinivivax streblomastigis]
MQKISILIFFLLALNLSAQEASQSKIDSLVREIQKVATVNAQQQTDIKTLNKKLRNVTDTVSELQTKLQQSQTNIKQTLDKKIGDSEQKTNKQIAGVNNSVGKKSLFAGIGGIVLLLLSIALFLWLYRTQKSNSADIIQQLEKTKSSIDEKLVAEFAKQADVMESLLKTLRELPVTASDSGELDHSLALKLSDEITLIERNISLMDAGTKGLKQLNRSIGKLKDNLAANGYEIPELLGKPYNEGMKATITNTIQDENLEKGVEVITKIVKPQVNYQDKMIQAAQIEVSIG